MEFAIYAWYFNSDGTKSGYLVDSGNAEFLDLDKYTYEYCKEMIYWSFEWIEITITAGTEKIILKKTYNEMQRKGGQAKSEKKAAASRENGKKGGRPRKKAE